MSYDSSWIHIYIYTIVFIYLFFCPSIYSQILEIFATTVIYKIPEIKMHKTVILSVALQVRVYEY
jgi:hypothetical protein